MRVSTQQINQSSVNQMINQQADINKTQLQLSAGRSILTPSDAPVEFAKTFLLSSEISRIERYQENNSIADQQLSLTDQVMSQASDLLTHFRTLTIQSRNATVTDADRITIATQMTQILDQIMVLANSKNANGDYIFSGYAIKSQPVVKDQYGNYGYQGDDGIKTIPIGLNQELEISNTAKSIFFDIPAANGVPQIYSSISNTGQTEIANLSVADPATWTANMNTGYTIVFNTPNPQANYSVYADTDLVNPLPGLANVTFQSGDQVSIAGITFNIEGSPQLGDTFHLETANNQSLFDSLTNIIHAVTVLGQSPSTATQFNYQMDLGLASLDQVEQYISLQHTLVGTRLNVKDQQVELNTSLLTMDNQSIAKLVEIDPIEGISKLTQQRQLLEMAQMSFIKIQNLSLFNFLR